MFHEITIVVCLSLLRGLLPRFVIYYGFILCSLTLTGRSRQKKENGSSLFLQPKKAKSCGETVNMYIYNNSYIYMYIYILVWWTWWWSESTAYSQTWLLIQNKNELRHILLA